MEREDDEVAEAFYFDTKSRGVVWQRGQIFFGGTGIDDEAEEILTLEINDEVVDHTGLLIEHAGIERLAWHFQFGDVVSNEMASELTCAGAFQVYRRHVRSIKHAASVAHRAGFV